MKDGDAAMSLGLVAQISLTPGEHRLIFRNDHLPTISVYQANVLLPATEMIRITEQHRDRLQHEFLLGFRVLPSVTPASEIATESTWRVRSGVLPSGAFLTGLTLLFARRIWVRKTTF